MASEPKNSKACLLKMTMKELINLAMPSGDPSGNYSTIPQVTVMLHRLDSLNRPLSTEDILCTEFNTVTDNPTQNHRASEIPILRQSIRSNSDSKIDFYTSTIQLAGSSPDVFHRGVFVVSGLCELVVYDIIFSFIRSS